MGDVVAEVAAVSKRYDTALALRDASATFPAGRVTGLLGHNGAGKSTLIKLVLGLIRPTVGEVRVFGRSPTAAGSRALRARLAYLPEDVVFYQNLTGREVIEYLAALKRVPWRRGVELLEKTGLADAVDRRVGTYSRGMRQRLGLAQALLGSPELLLLDEPTAGLDPMATLDFYRLIGELRSEGRSVIISSHLLTELEPHLDQAVILGHGHVLAQGTVAAMCETAGLPVTLSARLRGDAADFGDPAWLARLRVRVRRRHESVLELDVPAVHKMEAVRALIQEPAVVDIDVREPTLARLYARMSAD